MIVENLCRAEGRRETRWRTLAFLVASDDAEVVEAAIARVRENGSPGHDGPNPRGGALLALAAECLSAHGWPEEKRSRDCAS